MKLKRTPQFLKAAKIPPGAALIWPTGTPKPFFVDVRFLMRIRKVNWVYVTKGNRARGFFGKNKSRQYLHRFVISLSGQYFPEVTFANGDWFDCRLVNLKPYRREEDGARRRMFKNNTSNKKGVCFHKPSGKWIAMIRCRGKLKHLGYHPTAERAAKAYAAAWKLAHPNLTPLWEINN